MEIGKCKNITDYLEICNVQSIDELSDEQVFMWAKSGKMGIKTQNAVFMVEYGLHRRKPNKLKAIQLLREAIKGNMSFYCSYIEHESCVNPVEIKENNEYFEMNIR